MERYFNTTGPCDPRWHYMLPPEARLPELNHFIERRQYFVLHAARQTGKTTAMRALAERLRGGGVVALHATLEMSQGASEVAEAEPRWLRSIADEAEYNLPPHHRPPPVSAYLQDEAGSRLKRWLSAWSSALAPVLLVLLLDEADVVTGPAMVSLLRQLRAGFHNRPASAPASIALIGMRDLRDYLVQAKDGVPVNPGSPFNIKAASLTLRPFTRDEVAALYAQHTADTGQEFLPETVDRAVWWSGGHPFLVNALAGLAVDEIAKDRSLPVTVADIDAAKERLIHSRTTHLDNLAHRLREPRVVRFVEAALLGDQASIDSSSDDFQYVVDLGLLVKNQSGVQVANPIYRETMARHLSAHVQDALPQPWWPWLRPDGRLDFNALIDAFVGWWRRHADMLLESDPTPYREAAAHLAFMGFLQRVVNGGGTVEREYAAGRGRIDLVVDYGPDRFVVELKRVPPRWRTLEEIEEDGVAQLSGYLDTLDLHEGWLVIFDQRAGRTWAERCWAKEVEHGGKRLHLRGG